MSVRMDVRWMPSRKDNMLIVSVNYDKDVSSTDVFYKHHSCSIEKPVA